jgi:hypothetical protein
MLTRTLDPLTRALLWVLACPFDLLVYWVVTRPERRRIAAQGLR